MRASIIVVCMAAALAPSVASAQYRAYLAPWLSARAHTVNGPVQLDDRGSGLVVTIPGVSGQGFQLEPSGGRLVVSLPWSGPSVWTAHYWPGGGPIQLPNGTEFGLDWSPNVAIDFPSGPPATVGNDGRGGLVVDMPTSNGPPITVGPASGGMTISFPGFTTVTIPTSNGPFQLPTGGTIVVQLPTGGGFPLDQGGGNTTVSLPGGTVVYIPYNGRWIGRRIAGPISGRWNAAGFARQN